MQIVLNTFGSSVNRDNDGFVITNADGRQRLPVESVSSILVGRGAQITSDAVMLAVEREIEVLFVDRAGSVIGRVWSPKFGSISTIRKGQLAFSESTDAVMWIKEVVCRKIENQQALLLMMQTSDLAVRTVVESAIAQMEDCRCKLKKVNGDVPMDVATTVRGLEGVSAKLYFETMNIFLPEKYKFKERSQHPATDVTNALLNYGYGLMYGKIEGALVRAGIDPYIGILHRNEYNRPVLAYDVIELYRVWVDYVVWALLMQNAVTDEFYSVRQDGSCWLEGLGRRVLIQSINDYLDEVVTLRGVSRSRRTQILLYAQDLAQRFKKFQ